MAKVDKIYSATIPESPVAKRATLSVREGVQKDLNEREDELVVFLSIGNKVSKIHILFKGLKNKLVSKNLNCNLIKV